MKTLVGLFGCGKQAPKHISGLMSVPDVQVVLCDRDPNLAESLANDLGLEYVNHEDDIFNLKDLSAIDICTPVDSHLGLIRKAAERGVDFFCEKPLCASLEEAEEIARVIGKTDNFGQIGFNYRYSPAMKEAQNILDTVPSMGTSSTLGRITGGVFRVGGRGGHQLWKHKSETGGGAINEMMVHLIDLFIGLIGEISEVDVLDKRLVRPIRNIAGETHVVDAEDFIVVKLTSTTGVSIICQADLTTPSFIHYVDIAGENGNFYGSIQPDMRNFVYCENAAGGYEKGQTSLDFGRRNFFEAQMADFVNSVRTRVEPKSGTVKDSVQILSVLDKIRAS